MTELEIIARAQMYLEKLANGVNPLTNEYCQLCDFYAHSPTILCFRGDCGYSGL